MHKKHFLFLSYVVAFFNFLNCTVPPSPKNSLIASLAAAHSTQELPLSSTSRSILRLFYITEHLEPALTFIKKMTLQSKKIDEQCAYRIVSLFSGTALLKSEKMKTVFLHITEQHSLSPLLIVWDRIKQFKYGINPQEKNLLLDFSKLCLVAYQFTLVTLNQKNASPLPCISPEDLNSFEQIDEVFETMESYSFFYFLRKPLIQTKTITPSPKNSNVHEFCASLALRYYLNERLKITFSLFTSFHKKKIPLFTQGIEYLGFKKEDIIFDDQVIATYFDLLQEEKQLTPFIQLMKQFQSFDFIKNATFVKEFLVLLCIVYKDLLLENNLTSRLPEITEKLHELSLEQLLFLIDNINEKYVAKFFSSKPIIQKDSSLPTLIEYEYGVSPHTFTNLIFHRYYYIKRLQSVVKTLLKLTIQKQFTPTKTSLFLKPFTMAWEDFIAYKDVCDQQLIIDFTKEIYTLSQTLLYHHPNHHYTHALQFFLSKPKLFSVLEKSLSNEQSMLIDDFKQTIEIDKIISRFYVIKRLNPIMTKINMLYANNLLHLNCTTIIDKNDPCLKKLSLSKEPIITMIHDIYRTDTFKPIFTLWNGISHYKYIQDEDLCSEFAQFIIHLIHNTTHSTKKGLLPLDQLNEMPLEDILNLLDILVEELPLFLNENEINANMHWKDWLKKYWLIAPLRTAIFGITVYLTYKGVMKKSNHQQPLNPQTDIL